jgi:K+ transporter
MLNILNVSVFLAYLPDRSVASLLRSIVVPSVSCLVLLYFFYIISKHGTSFVKKVVENKMFCFFSATFFWNISDSRKNSDVEIATFSKILGYFSPIVPPSAAWFASVASDAGGLLW